MTEAVRYSETITIRCQPEVNALVDRAARAKGTKPSEYLRQALLHGLKADGFGLGTGDSQAPADAFPAPSGTAQHPTDETHPATPQSQQTASEIA